MNIYVVDSFVIDIYDILRQYISCNAHETPSSLIQHTIPNMTRFGFEVSYAVSPTTHRSMRFSSLGIAHCCAVSPDEEYYLNDIWARPNNMHRNQ